jgi:CHAT domain-containing protein
MEGKPSSIIMLEMAAKTHKKKQEGQNRPRLFFCPTGMFSFLPLHAAGLYMPHNYEDSCCLSDYCVVSYTPTLGALLASRNNLSKAHRDDVRILLAAAPEPFSSIALPAAREEINIISKIVPSTSFVSPSAEEASGVTPTSVSTADEVLRLLPDTTILHLACHGIQSTSKPLESGFIMHDRMMQVGDLIRLNLPNARLAFLSACETAQGDMEHPDEALHLAATMLYAGFKSVVGTMWSIGDVDGPIIAKKVYEELFAGEDEELDFDIVPYALDAAVCKLRAQGLEPSRWAPYIHIGM